MEIINYETAEINERLARVDTLESRVSGLTGLKFVNSTAEMTDTTRTYVNAADGNWYEYSGGSWVSRGQYGGAQVDAELETAGAAADAKATGGKIAWLESTLADIGADTTPFSLTVGVIDDNPNCVIRADGSVGATASAIGVSNPLYCKPGATLTYKLSTQKSNLILAVYGATGQLNYSVAGTGYSSYLTGSYTFTNADAYYRICGVTGGTYRNNYSLTYDYFPPHIVRKETYNADIGEINATIKFSEPTEVKTLLTNGGGIKPDGTVNNGESVAAAYSYSDYIPFKKGSTIIYSNVRVTNLCAISAYNLNKVFDSNSAVIATTTISGNWTMPFDGYVRLCCRNTELSGDASFVACNPAGAEIARLTARVDALEEVLPAEWETYLETKKTDIKAALVSIGSTGEAFTFVTDVHVPRNNMLTPQILRVLEKDCPVNYHINGGDFIDINTDSAQSAINVLWQWKDAMYGMTEYCALGNHDFNNYNSENPDNVLTAGQFYAVMDRQMENVVDTAGQTYYCIDNESQKIRIIVLDTSLASKTTMYAWMSERLTELDSAWTILIVQHYLWGSTTATIHSNGQATIDAINAVYSQISADLIGILAGHTHVDYNATEAINGYLLIARDTNMVKGGTGTNSLSFDYVTINTTANTISFTKIGRGSDLSLSY